MRRKTNFSMQELDDVLILLDDVKQDYSSTRNWVAVLYPENMIPDWQNKIYRLLQVPFCYIIHDKDLIEDLDDRVVTFDIKEGKKDLNSERVVLDNAGKRKTHIHLMVHYSNTTTYKSALALFQSLSALGKRCCNTCQPVRNIANMWHYFIHNTEDCIKANKYRYSPEERICGNNWDLGAFIALEQQSNEELLELLTLHIRQYNITSYHKIVFASLDHKFDSAFRKLDCPVSPFQFVKANRAFLAEICKGVYFDLQEAKEKNSDKV